MRFAMTVTPAPAASLVLLRDRDVVEVLLIQRHRGSRFAGGDFVFAGGKVEADDNPPDAIEWCRGLTMAEAARRLSLANPQPAPGTAMSQRTISVKIEVSEAPADNQRPSGSGARDLRLFRNGSLVKVWRGDPMKGQARATLETEIQIAAGPNRLTAYAFNRDNVKSTDATLTINGPDSLKRAGTAYLLAVGVNQYANPQFNLRFAVADASDFAAEVQQLGVHDR